jgi:hypothetical protein
LEGPSFPGADAGKARAAIQARETFGKVTLTTGDTSWGGA